MIAKHLITNPFSLVTAQALQEWAEQNIIGKDLETAGMRIGYSTDGIMFAEQAVTGLTIGQEYTLYINMFQIASNQFKIHVNTSANDNSTSIAELGYGAGLRQLTFTATQTTHYIAIGDNISNVNVYSITDNISMKDGTTELITNGTFEAGITGWTAQNASLTQYLYTPLSGGLKLYEEARILPAYDAGNPSHIIINASNWNEATMNNATYKHHFITGGISYGSYDNAFTITKEGTILEPCTIQLYQNGDTHPASLTANEAIDMKDSIQIRGDNWSIDRLSSFTDSTNMVWTKNCTNIVINRMHTDGAGISVLIDEGSSKVVVQNSDFRNMPLGLDAVAVNFAIWNGGTTNGSMLDCKVIWNDFTNMNDAFQVTVSGSTQQYINMSGFIAYGNNVWLSVLQDYTPNPPIAGKTSLLENGVDFKGGTPNREFSISPSNPYVRAIIKGNKFWNYRRTYGTKEGAVIASMQANGYDITENLFDNCEIAISGGSNPISGYSDGFYNTKVNKNIIVGAGSLNAYPLVFNNSRFCDLGGNYLIRNATDGSIGLFGDNGNESTPHESVEFGTTTISNTICVGFNEAPSSSVGNSNAASFLASITYDVQADTNYLDFTFTYDRYRTTPQQKTVLKCINPNDIFDIPTN